MRDLRAGDVTPERELRRIRKNYNRNAERYDRGIGFLDRRRKRIAEPLFIDWVHGILGISRSQGPP